MRSAKTVTQDLITHRLAQIPLHRCDSKKNCPILMKFCTQQHIQNSMTVTRPNVIFFYFKIADGRHIDKQSSPAVAERPRDASCLSVVSFSGTTRRAQSSIIGYFRLIQLNFCSILLCSAYPLMHGVLCRKPTCTVTVIHYWTDDHQLLITLALAVIDLIARYWPKSRFVPTPLACDAVVRGGLLGGPRRNQSIRNF